MRTELRWVGGLAVRVSLVGGAGRLAGWNAAPAPRRALLGENQLPESRLPEKIDRFVVEDGQL